MQRVITAFIVIAYVNCQIGCTTWVKKEENRLITNDNDLIVKLNNSEEIYFEANNYKVKEDTLFGMGGLYLSDTTFYKNKHEVKRISHSVLTPEYRIVSGNEITELKAKEVNSSRTVWLVVIIGIGVGILLLTVDVPSEPIMDGPMPDLYIPH